MTEPAEKPARRAAKKKPEVEDLIDPRIRAKLAPIERAEGRAPTLAAYNKLVDDRNRMAEALTQIARQTVQYTPPLHLLRYERRMLRDMIANPYGITFKKDSE